MHALAHLRGRLVRLKETARPAAEDALALADESLQVVDTLRAECAALEKRCFTLETQIEAHDRDTHAILDVAPVAIVITDHGGRILHANSAATALLGRSAPRLKEELLLHFFDDRAAFTDVLRSAMSANAPIRTSLQLRPRERAPFEAEITLAPDPREGDARCVWFLGRAGEAPLTTRKRIGSAPDAARLQPRES